MRQAASFTIPLILFKPRRTASLPSAIGSRHASHPLVQTSTDLTSTSCRRAILHQRVAAMKNHGLAVEQGGQELGGMMAYGKR
ncbi:hypothetical protein CSQ91_08495 [Janthinobacterium sp. BJB301]|nr:hypothetical protein CSQ91_08495 [Janthinobacterium sp. BJB301]